MEIRYQIQFYTTNDLLIHPIGIPALAYLCGLPPRVGKMCSGTGLYSCVGYKDIHADGLR